MSAYSGAAAAEPGMLACEVQAARLPTDLEIIRAIERDRVHKSAQPGFIHEWVTVGLRDGVWLQLLFSFDTVEHAAAFSSWLDHYALGGTLFWDRPDFAPGHRCHTYQVLGSEDRPPAADTQVDMREERFTVAAGTSPDQLRAWFEQVRRASHRRGDTSVMLLYSETERLASLVAFGAVPRPERNRFALPPIRALAPLLPPQTGTLDWSAWVFSIFFPFAPGDHGRPSLWPLPDLEPYRGDGVCEVSRHESWHVTSDCPRSCGDGVQDLDEDWESCPGDVPLP